MSWASVVAVGVGEYVACRVIRSREDAVSGMPPRLRAARRRPLPLAMLTFLLVATGALTLLAGCSISLGGSAHTWTFSESATSTASAGNTGEQLGDSTGSAGNPTPTTGQGASALSTTPTARPYTGHNYMSVGYDPSSCHPSAVSPYPYLDVGNASQTTAMSWHYSLSNGAFSLRASPPNPIPAGISEFWAFVGPMSTTTPLYVSISGSIGSWSGTLQPCSVQKPPTPTPYVTVTPNVPTVQNLSITFTCAQAVASVSAEVCIHTLPNAIVGIDSVN